MVDTTEKIENSELVTNRDQLVVVDNIESLIKVIRGQQVMLDKDLAMLYGVEAKVLNQAVKRNVERFPDDFRFQLTKEECLRSQIVTLNEKQGQHLKYMPYAFTEQGVAMLSSVLRSKTAIEVNIQIMRAFVSMRHFMVNNASVFSRLETIEYHQLEILQHQQDTDKHLQESDKRIEDHFLCIDDDVYHIGASIKDLGKKWFAFSKLDILSPDMLIEKIKSNN